MFVLSLIMADKITGKQKNKRRIVNICFLVFFFLGFEGMTAVSDFQSIYLPTLVNGLITVMSIFVAIAVFSFSQIQVRIKDKGLRLIHG
jgi:hypothetical protein